ncbi:MAG: choice-of-anchor O protein [Chloroflexi bacterium]|nr:choice-of-anchor O protein [Chloroflexota bacterium]
MKFKKTVFSLMSVIVIAGVLAGLTLADDGQIFRRNISKTPDGLTLEANIAMMPFYVPAQTSSGELTTIEYYDAADALVQTRDFAKPLISIYIDSIDEEENLPLGAEAVASGVEFDKRDAFAALSLDDGATWKTTNLSRAADLTSFTLANGHEYPGDAHYMEFAIAGNYVLAVWLSKYCSGGTPAYTLVDDVTGEPLYPDLFGVAGAQSSVDYTLQGYPEIGEIPYSCLWTARGTLELDDETGLYDILWRKAERLTSGRRDANVAAMDGAPGAGFSIVWQEDPEGLRPGQGLGPGEGWSGAIVNQKTDMWYSYIGWEDFDDYLVDELDPDAMPKPSVPMAIPSRLTDNNMCRGTIKFDDNGNVLDPYCYEDFNANGLADLCATTASWLNPGGTTLDICQTEDGRVLTGRTGASRTRLSLQPYTRADGTTSAWLIMAYEETKALGTGGEDIDPIDIGKNVWYHTFDMFNPDIAAQGMMLNQPAIDPATGAFFPLLTDDMGNEFYETEISRRFALMAQPPNAIINSTVGTSLITIFKQGTINQGGPADIMLRRFVAPDVYSPTVDNPYAYANMVCASRVYTDGLNPNYINGVCLDPAINSSSPTPVLCEGGACPTELPEPGSDEAYPRVIEWLQTEENLDDLPWENPFDVSKGHRGFIDGDVVMLMYAWSPNWQQNSVGNDHYNLYVRRSFDGGQTWTTTPAELGGDGTTTCENYGITGDAAYTVCTDYAAGEYEQARNVSQLVGNKVTILDPRYTPSAGPKKWAVTDALNVGGGALPYEDDAVRDRSRFFIVYETGDNTTVDVGEAVPLDLYYSRGYDYGDEYDVVEWYNAQTGEVEERWDWLENKADELSGEAMVWTNPSATFFYAVWNQFKEDDHEVVYDSDIWFRRVMYLDDDDAVPTASILYISDRAAGHDDGKLLTFIGTAVDNDHIGDDIVAYQWRSDRDGVLSDQKDFTILSTDLSLGAHKIYFTAQDGEGNWSREIYTTLLIGESVHQIHLPAILR